ncbi:MORN repeat-containing protein 4 [Lingula anatina]|uniref:MORN repeat-containing protein 4 n=1 Tax=Lingula anatina TaxID=7574 RepID=A0A1S3JQS5_LINAN|nr:MORN repeat-containing protein 4 [Lingula anatina]XP_013412750.1 MORN repeat-containing protein 4 [Lingula anatina]|eukprot:XP_013412743.1 MORN repeat-containing protein 4 [Lingula anatina]
MHGTYKYPDGSEYTGQWNDQGQRHGSGQLMLSDGSKYHGKFENGLFHGYGVMIMQDGSRYEGEFSQGKFSGFGVFTRCDGMKFQGEFREGKVSGQGLLTFADGTHGLPRNEGRFEGNKLIKSCKCPNAIQKATQAADRARTQQV